MTKAKNPYVFLWGGLDLLTFLSMSMYISTAHSYGSSGLDAIALVRFLLHTLLLLSLLFSAGFLVRKPKLANIIYLCQLPLRLYFFVTSFQFIYETVFHWNCYQDDWRVKALFYGLELFRVIYVIRFFQINFSSKTESELLDDD